MSQALAFISEWDSGLDWRREIERHLGPTDWRDWPALGRREDVEVALAWAPPRGALASLPNLRLIVSLGMGADHLLRDDTLPAAPPIVRINDSQLIEQMVEYALLASLRVLRLADTYDAQQRRTEWHRLALTEARDVGVGIMGLGAIGRAIALAHCRLGFAVRGWSRTAQAIGGIGCFAGDDALGAFLAGCDILVCVLPLTNVTRGIINARTLALLPVGAHVVNVARGGHVVDADLLAALDAGQIGGATLDVFSHEPLPPDHPYWRHPKVRVTPHIAGQSNPRTSAPGVADNIRRLRAGQNLHDLIDRRAGY